MLLWSQKTYASILNNWGCCLWNFVLETSVGLGARVCIGCHNRGWIPSLHKASRGASLSFIIVCRPRSLARKVAPKKGSTDRWLKKNCTWNGEAEDFTLPIAVRWVPRRSQPSAPKGLHACLPHEVDRWRRSRFSMPPYQFRDVNCISTEDGSL